MIKIRLRRVGKTKRPYYRVVVAENEAKRDGAFLDTLGSYDPHAVPPAATLNEERAKEWLAKGAKPSEAAEKILRRAGIITTPAPERVQKPSAKAAASEPAGAPAAEATATAEPVAAEAPEATPPAAAEEAEKPAEAESE
ncbi:MAG: 30S ribosomal protein S16 [Dehalococcoidia bacterium]|nr:30S ribosomal protein S16 [Dehalococcoidia bacterium]